ncbi:MAG TPA: hypothetical protein VLZ12_14460 [Verrucomicrobiae bacterium]|nr:hypothetical protein [Verrucomicrobiae bacterium]
MQIFKRAKVSSKSIEDQPRPGTIYDIGKEDMWVCPYCNQRIRLTWPLYLTQPGLKHKCPHCWKVSKLSGSVSPRLWAARTGAVLLGGVPLGIIGHQFGFLRGLICFVVGGLLTGLPVDKYFDERFRQLIEIKGEEKNHSEVRNKKKPDG